MSRLLYMGLLLGWQLFCLMRKQLIKLLDWQNSMSGYYQGAQVVFEAENTEEGDRRKYKV